MTPQQNDNESDLHYIIDNDESGKKRSKHSVKVSNRTRKKRSKASKIAVIILLIVLGIIIAAAIALVILVISGKSQMLKAGGAINISKTNKFSVASEDGGKTITYGGKTYIYNDKVTSILCMGIDKTSLNDGTNTYGANGQSDANLLMAIDTESGKTSVINVNRDTMVDVKVYAKSGTFGGAEKKQLCLAYASGDGKTLSCENTVKAVSDIFYGIPINSYFAIDLNAIGPLNDAVGAVTVTPPESFTYSGINYVKGQSTLLNSALKATGYVRYRNTAVLDSNISRMKRQQEYLKNYSEAAINKTKSNISFPITLYNTAKGYNYNNIGIAKISYLASIIMTKNAGRNMEFLSIDGNIKAGEKFTEFTPDETKLFETVLKVYYKEKT